MGLSVNKTILLVEDDVILSMAEKKMLEKLGYKVFVANSGEEAIDSFKKNGGINLILMDIDLGAGIDGTQAAEIILGYRYVPIVFLSSHIEAEIVEKTEKITSYGYVVKGSGITVIDASIKMAFKLFEANRKIAESEINQRALISNISDVIAIIGADGVNLYKSPNIEKWFGWTPEEVIGSSTWKNIHPDHIEETQKIFKKLLDEPGASISGECMYLCKDGSYKWIEYNAVNLIQDPVINGIMLNYHDISERKQAEKLLHQSHSLLEKLACLVPGVVYQYRLYPDGRSAFPYSSPGMNMIYEVTPQQVREDATPVFGRLHPEDYKMVADAIFESARTLQTFYCEFRVILPKQGLRWRWSQAHPERTEDGGTLWHGIISDITERKQAEESLRETNEYLENLINYANAPIIVWDNSFAITRFNHAFEQLSGYDAGEVISKKVDILFPENKVADSLQLIKTAVEGQRWESVEIEILRKDGKIRTVLWNSANIADKSGKNIAGTIAQGQDITGRKRSEDALQLKIKQNTVLLKAAHFILNVENFNEAARHVFDSCCMLTGATAGYVALLSEDGSENQVLFLEAGGRDCTVDPSLPMPIRGLRAEAYKTGKAVYDNNFNSSQWMKFMPQGHMPLNNVLFAPLNIGGKTVGIMGVANKPSDFTDEDAHLAEAFGSLAAMSLKNSRALQLLRKNKDKIQALLLEKELLLKEVHHRIKNNMNTVASIMTLQTENLKEPTAIEAINDARNRVVSMMVLYDKLYRSNDFKETSFKKYISPLLDEIIDNFPNRTLIKIEKNIDDFMIDAKMISHIGIVINELLTNAMKHAFAGRQKGLITVSASIKNNVVTIIVKDDGVGIRESIDISNPDGFGLQLVDMLAKQLRASIKIERGGGSKFILEFNI